MFHQLLRIGKVTLFLGISGLIGTPGVAAQSRLLSPEKRIVFEPTPFATGSTVPYWDNGYLISIVPETTSAGSPNVRLYDAKGAKVRESSFWFPDANAVYILSAAVNKEGTIVASGIAVKADGTRASFIAAADSVGNMMQVVQTNPFSPANICTDADGTVWSFGDLSSDPSAGPEAKLLRQFDLKRGLVNEYLPRSLFGASGPPALRGGDGREVYFRCIKEKIAIYSGGARIYIEFNPATRSFRTFKMTAPEAGLGLKGFAVTTTGNVYACLRSYSKPEVPQGLFELDLDASKGVARWLQIEGGAGPTSQPGVVSRLWGADGEYLVHGVQNDPAGRWAVSWSQPTNTSGPSKN